MADICEGKSICEDKSCMKVERSHPYCYCYCHHVPLYFVTLLWLGKESRLSLHSLCATLCHFFFSKVAP